MDAPGTRGIDFQPPRVFEAIQQRDDVRGRGRLRIVPQPGEAGPAQVRIDGQQPRKRVPLRIGQPGRERLEGLPPRACTGCRPIRSSTAAVGSRTPFARRWASIAWTIGSPRSVAHAASAPTRRQARQSARPKLRRPGTLQLKQMLAAGLIPACVVGEDSGRITPSLVARQRRASARAAAPRGPNRGRDGGGAQSWTAKPSRLIDRRFAGQGPDQQRRARNGWPSRRNRSGWRTTGFVAQKTAGCERACRAPVGGRARS